MDIEDLSLLTDVAQHLSFAEVARRRNVDPSMISRTISNIESQLGFALFHRTTRKMSLTSAGQTYVQKISPLVEELQNAKSEALSQNQKPTGSVRLTASTAFGNQVILPLIEKFTAQLPQIELQLQLTDQNLDLVDHQIDLAIRLTDQPKGDLICAKLMDTHYQIVSSPALDAPLEHPSDLANVNCPLLDLPRYRDVWQFKRGGEQHAVAINGTIRMSNPLALREAARLGLGPALLPNWLVKDDLTTGRLVPHFADWQVTATSFDTAAWLIYAPQRFMPARLRATIDFLRTNVK